MFKEVLNSFSIGISLGFQSIYLWISLEALKHLEFLLNTSETSSKPLQSVLQDSGLRKSLRNTSKTA